MTDLIPLTPRLMQDCEIFIAKGLGTYLGNDRYHYLSAINILESLIVQERGEDFIKKKVPNYSREKLKKWVSNYFDIKVFYDAIEDKKLLKDQKEFQIRQFLYHSVSKVKLIDKDFYDLYVFLVSSTTLSRRTIKNQYIKLVEHTGYKTLHLEKKKKDIEDVKE